MEIGGDRYRTVGGVHRIPIDGVSGMLVLAGLEAVGPDAAALLGHVGAETMVCLQTDAEIDRRYPPYLEWLADPEPHEALRLPIEDHLVAPDGPMTSLIEAIVDRLDGGAVSSCTAGLVGDVPDSWGRWCSSPMAPRSPRRSTGCVPPGRLPDRSLMSRISN